MLHQVLRRFSAEGRVLRVGDLVETSHWRNERLLLEHRFIGRPSAPPQQMPVPVKVDGEEDRGSVEAVSPAQSAASPEELPKALQEPPKPKKPVPVVGRVPIAKARE